MIATHKLSLTSELCKPIKVGFNITARMLEITIYTMNQQLVTPITSDMVINAKNVVKKCKQYLKDMGMSYFEYDFYDDKPFTAIDDMPNEIIETSKKLFPSFYEK